MNKYRIGTDVPFQLSVDDGVEYLDLSNCTNLNVAMYCDAQEAFAPPAACVIEVPSAFLATYQAANIWADYASQMVGV